MPDLPDHRDILYSVVRKVPAVLPPSVDLRPMCSKVEDQENLGSCTGNALVGGLEFLERKDRVPYAELSRLFVYYNGGSSGHLVVCINLTRDKRGLVFSISDCPIAHAGYAEHISPQNHHFLLS